MSIILRSVKGSPLTIEEVDSNFSQLSIGIGTKLDASAYTALDVIAKLKTVDGAGSGLDADLLDGLTAISGATGASVVARDSSGNFAANTITANVVGNVTGDITGSLYAADLTKIVDAVTKAFTGSLTGNVVGNVTGYLTGDISGNAATVTNGLYTTGSYSNPSWLTALSASKLTSGTIPSATLGNSSLYIGTTAVALNRASASLNLTGVSIDGNAGTVTNGLYSTGTYTNPSWLSSLAGSKITGNISGNAGTATKLASAVTIAGNSFDGSSNITIAASNLSDVSIVSPTNNQLLVYNSTTSRWTNTSGITGPTGATGPQGIQGASGASGATGFQGASGATGTQGASGSTGLPGASGATGFQGASGATGTQGASGATGLPGATGGRGLQGASGATGLPGASGATGFQGASGATGIGATGATGLTGATGPNGIGGATGTGLPGATGATGAMGPQGASGVGITSVNFSDDIFSIYDNVDNTKVMQFQASNIAPNTTRTLTIPNEDGTIATRSYTDGAINTATANMLVSTGTYSNPSWITSLAGSKVSNIPNSSLTYSSITINGVAISLGGSVTTPTLSSDNTWTGTQTFADDKFVIVDNVDGTKKLNLQISNISNNTTRTLTVPNADGTIATREWVGASGLISIAALSDVSVTSPTNNQLLVYNSGTGKWTNTSGITGPIGASGATGAAGSNGVQGASGATGAAGANGAQGASGATGSAGANGAQGASGATGSAGVQGASGATGVGTTGAQGASGATGPAGSNGVQGASGATGAGPTITDDTSSNVSYYPGMYSVNNGIPSSQYVSSTKLYYNPATGTLNAVSFNSLSDVNFKFDIEAVTNAVEVINNINGVSFKWKETGKSTYGVIAQDIEKVLPNIVNTNQDGIKSVDYQALTAYLIEAIKELNVRIKVLESK